MRDGAQDSSIEDLHIKMAAHHKHPASKFLGFCQEFKVIDLRFFPCYSHFKPPFCIKTLDFHSIFYY